MKQVAWWPINAADEPGWRGVVGNTLSLLLGLMVAVVVCLAVIAATVLLVVGLKAAF